MFRSAVSDGGDTESCTVYEGLTFQSNVLRMTSMCDNTNQPFSASRACNTLHIEGKDTLCGFVAVCVLTLKHCRHHQQQRRKMTM